MRQLQAHDQVVSRAAGCSVRLLALAKHSLQFWRCLFVDEQLPRVRPALFNDCCCLSPDEFRAARTKPPIAPKRQLIRPAVKRAVAPFHGLNAQRIARAQRTNGDRTKKRTEIM